MDNMPFIPTLQKPPKFNFFWLIWALMFLLIIMVKLKAKEIQPEEGLNKVNIAHQNLEPTRGHVNLLLDSRINANGGLPLVASWYSIESLKKEGIYKYSKGRMANGEYFNDNLMVCATRLFPLGSILRVVNPVNKKTVIVKVTDRIGKRFANTRIDLTPMAFSKLDKLEKGIVVVKVEIIK